MLGGTAEHGTGMLKPELSCDSAVLLRLRRATWSVFRHIPPETALIHRSSAIPLLYATTKNTHDDVSFLKTLLHFIGISPPTWLGGFRFLFLFSDSCTWQPWNHPNRSKMSSPANQSRHQTHQSISQPISNLSNNITIQPITQSTIQRFTW